MLRHTEEYYATDYVVCKLQLLHYIYEHYIINRD